MRDFSEVAELSKVKSYMIKVQDKRRMGIAMNTSSERRASCRELSAIYYFGFANASKLLRVAQCVRIPCQLSVKTIAVFSSLDFDSKVRLRNDPTLCSLGL